MNLENIILGSDSYKFSHWKQLPPGTTRYRAHGLPRGGPWSHVATYGAWQYMVRQLARRVEWWMLDEAEEVIDAHIAPGTFNRRGWERIMRQHDGILPLHLRACPEGMLVPVKNALWSLENTDDEVPWLPGFMESRVYPWYPYSVATLAHEVKKVCRRHLAISGTPANIDFMLNDFGLRATTDPMDTMQAQLGGSAHLLSFKGTDNVPSLMFLRRWYNAKMPGFSVNASEHSTICAWGREHEVDAYRNFLLQYPTGLAACVSDAYNIYEACDYLWGQVLKDEVLARQGVLVIRPDSGVPVEVVLKVLNILGNRFGFTINEKGFKVLNPKVRVIQGDGVSLEAIDLILTTMELPGNGWSADNIVFGMGGKLLMGVTRDTMKWKVAGSSILRNGEEVDVFKDPIDDKGKTSQAGDLTLYLTDDDEFKTDRVHLSTPPGRDIFETFYLNGDVRTAESWDVIRERFEMWEHRLGQAA